MGNRCSYDNVANYFPINIIALEIKILTIRQLIMTVLVFELLWDVLASSTYTRLLKYMVPARSGVIW